MLQKLQIRNFALIDQIEIGFDNDLTVITGETGAGKSILLGALALILGKRADHSTLKNKQQKCIVEGIFNIKGYALKPFFEANNLDYDDQTILRREVSPQGKSRNFINDTPTTLETMKSLGGRLIDIHSQQQSLLINDPHFQLQLIDSIAENTELLQSYKTIYKVYKSLLTEIKQLKEQISNSKLKEDYIKFQLEELTSISLKKGEYDNLDAQIQKFSNAEELIRNYSEMLRLFSESDSNLLDQFNEAKRLIDTTSRIDSSLDSLSERFDSLLIELSDLIRELEHKSEEFEYDPEQHKYIQERIDEIQRLQQKHQLIQADDLLQLREQLENDLAMISINEDEIVQKEKELTDVKKKIEKIADSLSKRRTAVIESLQQKVEYSLSKLGIPAAQLRIEQSKKEVSNNGIDQFSFLFSANKGVSPAPIAKTASGGELSRLMLSLKEILAEKTQLPTVLFDEIDTGVSGDIANKMGAILKKMGNRRQLIAITHLPQLAAKGQTHFLVYKKIVDQKSYTQIKKLSNEERVEELAKMLSGEKVSEAAIDNAKELLIQ